MSTPLTAREVLLQLEASGETDKETLVNAMIDTAGVVRKSALRMYRKVHPDPGYLPPPRPSKHSRQKFSSSKTSGLSREQIRLKHDIPAKLKHRLNAFIEGLTVGEFFEENQVRHACSVARSENEYWDEITSLPTYTPFAGYTEAGERLWGTEEDINWAVDNMTGFRRDV